MTPERRKTILIIAGTLIIGVLIGVLGTAMFARKHYRGERGPRGEMSKGSRQGFAKKFMHIVEADSSQLPALKPILDETMTKIDVIQSHSREEVKQVLDSMEVKLQPILRPEQMESLKKFHNERRQDRGGKEQR
jgi:hypothetical protein